MSLKKVLKTYRKKIYNKLHSRLKVKYPTENTVKLPKDGCVRIEIKGKNNTIIFPETITDNSVYTLSIVGNNNRIEINSSSQNNIKLNICGGYRPIENCTFTLGKYTTSKSAMFRLHESNSSIVIGEHCMISYDLLAWCTDMHCIYNKGSKTPSNIGKSIIIGNHVWIGKEVHIAKNTIIPDNCIVGWCSNVTSKFTEQNCIIAGNPACVVKHNIDWSPDCIDDILYQ